ncbi:MAG: arginase family protein [Hyphomicrobiaceae bacterium]
MAKQLNIIEAPLCTGVGLQGVEFMAGALREAGLQEAVGAVTWDAISEPVKATVVDPVTSLPEPELVRDFLLQLADHVEKVCNQEDIPLVVGGDCTILLGCLAGAKRRGKMGMLFVDGHTDFHKPGGGKTEPASMELYFATGRGPEVLSKLGGDAPLVRDRDVVCFGYQNGDRPYTGGADPKTVLSPADTDMLCLPLDRIRKRGFGNAVDTALKHLCADDRDFWLHVDVDVLDDREMPAVDYRLPDGLSVGETVETIRRAMKTDKVRGINLTIFNPTLDWDGSRASLLVELLGTALKNK